MRGFALTNYGWMWACRGRSLRQIQVRTFPGGLNCKVNIVFRCACAWFYKSEFSFAYAISGFLCQLVIPVLWRCHICQPAVTPTLTFPPDVPLFFPHILYTCQWYQNYPGSIHCDLLQRFSKGWACDCSIIKITHHPAPPQVKIDTIYMSYPLDRL